MKRKFHHPEPTERELTGPRYWRSPEELANVPEFRSVLEREFPEGASESTEQDRRQFLKLMGASAAFAGIGLTGCRMPRRYILPYAKQPEKMIPGVAIYYASSMPDSWDNIPLVVETHGARPTKLEGNPSYLDYRGGTNSYVQASVLDLYDPDRLQGSLSDQGTRPLSESGVETALQEISKKYGANRGKGLAFLLQPTTSPARAKLLSELKSKYPEAVFSEYEPVSFENPELGLKAISGKRYRPVYQLGQAKRVLALDSDFLTTGPGSLKHARDFADGRRIQNSSEADKMNRLYVVESTMSLTGAMADHRLRASTSQIPAFAALVCAEVLTQAGADSQLAAQLKELGKGVQVDPKWISECAADLVANRGESLIVAGAHLPVDVHMIVYAANAALGAEGKTVDYVAVPERDSLRLTDLTTRMNAGEVGTLIIVGGNPVYDAPADLGFSKALSKVPQVLYHGYYNNETSAQAHLTLAASHYLESWSDGRTYDGTYVPVQPMILPLFKTTSDLEMLGMLAGRNVTDNAYDLVKASFAEVTGKDDSISFEQWLAEGVWADSGFKKGMPTPRIASFGIPGKLRPEVFSAPALSASSLEFRILPSSHAWDGRYNNNGWLMECPDPLTKITWDNVISISPKLAKTLGVTPDPIMMDRLGQLHINANTYENGREIARMARLTVNGVSIEGPLHIQPGLADYTLVLTLGFGRSKTGRIGTRLNDPGKGEGIGFNVYPLVDSASPAVRVGGKLELLDKTYSLANTQEHWSMEGRAIIREANVSEYAEDPNFTGKMGVEAHSPPVLGSARLEALSETSRDIPRGGSLYKTPEFTARQQWGMNIDLNTCTACNACVIACQSENNIPIVGKDQVLRGREMHWIRLDRYYSAGPDASTLEIPEDPQVSFMGVACQHCELAPCESVCPVNATVHDDQGLNVMAYNRCVGTRYCANNCPYKVRRFNFFDYNKRERQELYKGPLGTNVYKTEASQLIRMQKNPNVSVRMRGVMEKCTYCVQRIESARINALAKAKDSPNVLVPDGTIKTACQQVCPTGAITFGDIADENTEVYKVKQSDRNYSLLGYLNIRPRTTYLSKLRNPNSKMPDYRKMPLTRAEYKAKSGHSAH